jgi:hypothetical protein
VEAFENLDGFKLADFGDRHEQRLWSLLSADFPAYEVFWRRYIVPLTHRVDPIFSFPGDRDSWIRIRPDVSARQEQLAMHHYSVFYYLGRATERVKSGQCEFPEDVFSLLDACGDNAFEFIRVAREILQDFGISIDSLPLRKDQLCCLADRQKATKLRGGLVEVQEYRDTILHNPVLGRGIQTPRQFLPRREFLKEIKLSWLKAERLNSEQLIETKSLYTRLIGEIASFLEETWEALIQKFDSIREQDKFRKQWSIREDFLPIAPAPALSMVGRPTADSSAVSSVSPSCSGAFTVHLPIKEEFWKLKDG